jgi:hypothetical protein
MVSIGGKVGSGKLIAAKKNALPSSRWLKRSA